MRQEKKSRMIKKSDFGDMDAFELLRVFVYQAHPLILVAALEQ